MNSDYVILINTTDRFSDCWEPYFILFGKYFADYKGKVYLNTEEKQYGYPNIDIIPICNKCDSKKTSWSECLLKALDKIDEETILYMQEDYFLFSQVLIEKIDFFAEMLNRKKLDCLYLTNQATAGPFIKTDNPHLLKVGNSASYRVSAQCALWNKDSLKKIIRKYESAWEFEKYGTLRSKYILHNVYNVNIEKYGVGKCEIIPYVYTGIIRGKWNPDVIPIFKANGIQMDYSIRGIVKYTKKSFANKIKDFISMKNIKTRIVSNLELFLLLIKLWGKNAFNLEKIEI